MMWDVTVPHSMVPSNHSAVVSCSGFVAAMAEARRKLSKYTHLPTSFSIFSVAI